MVGLLDLSSELLFEIIGFVLTAPIQWPEGNARYRLSLGEQYIYSVNTKFAPPPGLAGKHPATTLLLTNKRLYSETKTYLLSNTHSFDLDVAIIDDHWILPTWRNFPLRIGVLNKVNVHLLPCCTEYKRILQVNWDESDPFGPWRRDPDIWHPPEMSFAFALMNPMYQHRTEGTFDFAAVNTLGRLLQHMFPAMHGQEQCIISRIETLVFHIDTSLYGNGNRLLDGSEVPIRKFNGYSHLDFKKLYSCNANKAKFYLEDLMAYFKYWLYLRKEHSGDSKSIGKIKFCIDGKVVQEVDPTKHTVDDIKISPSHFWDNYKD